MQTDQPIPNNKPDIIIRDNENGTCAYVNGCRNFRGRECDPESGRGDSKIYSNHILLKYKNLKTEVQRLWNVKTKVILVKMGATETISKSFREYLSNVPAKHKINGL